VVEIIHSYLITATVLIQNVKVTASQTMVTSIHHEEKLRILIARVHLSIKYISISITTKW